MKSHDLPYEITFFWLKSPMKCSLLSWIWPPLVPLGASSGFLNWRTEHCLGPGTSAGSQRDLSGRGGLELVKGIHRGFSPIRCWESTSVFLGGLKAQRLKDHKNTTRGSFGCYVLSQLQQAEERQNNNSDMKSLSYLSICLRVIK